MLVLSVRLFGKALYKNVIVNGFVLAADGSKMSKSKRNHPPRTRCFRSLAPTHCT